ncbi:MAG: hypothetical protein JW712_03700 [Dehalococcoidales bacterium]|nr:hypothetical protein [Dehalococcoidales bacterium]
MIDKSDILPEILESIRSLYSSASLKPGVLRKVGLKSGWNVVIGSQGQCGMSMNFTGNEAAFGKVSLDTERMKSYVGLSLDEVAEVYIGSKSWQERSIGVAALSALSQPLMQPQALAKRGIKIRESGGGFAGLLKPDDIAVMVGYGGGVPNLIGKAKEVHVTDMRSRDEFQTLIIDDSVTYYPTEVFVHTEPENREVLENATAIAITGSSLVNGTFKELAGYAKNARLVTMYGASSSVVPDVLFKYGVHAVQSYILTDPTAFEEGMKNERSMEPVVHRTQKSQLMCSPHMKL